MKRLSLIAVGVMLSSVGFAQQQAPNTNTQNQNAPSVNMPEATPPTPAQKGTPTQSAPASVPAPGATPSSGASAGSQAQPSQPQTVMLPQGGSQGSADPLLEPKELPAKDMSLIGGIAKKVDPIRNRVVLQPFGGGHKIEVRFDDRSHIYRDGRETTVMAIQKNDKIYADTMLVDGHVFAKNLRVATKTQSAEASGQVTFVNERNGEVRLLDTLTGQPVSFQVTPRTAVQKHGAPATIADVKPGTLLDVRFVPGQKGGTARQVTVIAVPGDSFIFAGRVTYLDMSTGTVAIDNESDNKNYTVHFSPGAIDNREHLTLGSQVTARATFDGRGYRAQGLTLMAPASAEQ